MPSSTLDAALLGKNKGQIILGHAISEEPGIEDVANWLRTFIKDVPVQFIGRALLVSRLAGVNSIADAGM